MSHLCFGTFAKAIKDASPLSISATVDLLVGGLVKDTYIDISDKNKLFHCKKDLVYLKDAAQSKEVKSSICDYFQNEVIGKLSELKINALIEILRGLINGENNITKPDKKHLFSLADNENLSQFLGETFLFAASQDNNTKDNNLPQIMSGDIIAIQDGKIFLNGEEVPLPDKLVPPKEFDSMEAIYITELLKAYADKQKVSNYTIESLPLKYKKDIERHRQDFYNAEAMHRKIRDIYDDKENEFEKLKDDTLDGIIDTALMDYDNGYEKLLNVLAQVVKLEQGKSLMWLLPSWLGSSEKKGVCHILVNDRKLSWVVENEADI